MSCRTCHGLGTVETTDFVDYGTTAIPLTSDEPCPTCLERGLCPKCDVRLEWLDVQEYYICEACGWSEKPEEKPRRVNKLIGRPKKQHRARHGMRVSGRSALFHRATVSRKRKK